jgi:hypothetical protein
VFSVELLILKWLHPTIQAMGWSPLEGKMVRNIEMGCLHCHDPLPLAISPKLIIDEVGAYWFQLPFF